MQKQTKMGRGMVFFKIVISGAEKREIELKKMVEKFIDSFSWIEMRQVTIKRKKEDMEKVIGGGAKVRRVTY